MIKEFSMAIDVDAVWIKGKIIDNYDPAKFRKDDCGAWMIKELHNNTTTPFGWEIDYVIPLNMGGTDDLTNLRPLQWKNNRSKQSSYPNWNCVVTSQETANVDI